ncbi:MAG: hypothetical protein KC646_16785 [Candidatus Cloacimonetes bacterium]|nr:hypothetical protein [Candidatus Cloacimonadota bacterium]
MYRLFILLVSFTFHLQASTLSDLSVSKPAGKYTTPILLDFSISSPNRFMITVNDDPTIQEAKSFPCPYAISNKCSFVVARSTSLNVRVCGDNLTPMDCLYQFDSISNFSYQIETSTIKPSYESTELPDKFSWKHTYDFKVTNKPPDTDEYTVKTYLEIQGLSVGAFGEVKDGYADFFSIKRPPCGIGKVSTRRAAYLYYSLLPKGQSINRDAMILRSSYKRFDVIKNQPWTGWIQKFYINTSGASNSAWCKPFYEGRIFDYDEETRLEVPKQN